MFPTRAITLPGWHRPADPREAGHPFNFADADIIIRSSDGYDFRLHLFMLGLSSPVFKEMLAAKASHKTHPKTSHHIKDGLPILILTEDSSTLRLLFQHFYPGEHCSLLERSKSEVLAFVKAMDKYAVQNHTSTFESALSTLVDKQPHVVLALTLRHKFPQVRVTAAHSILRLPSILSEAVLSDNDITLYSVEQYRRVLLYHQECCATALRVLRSMDWAKQGWAVLSSGRRDDDLFSGFSHPRNCFCKRSAYPVYIRTPDTESLLSSHRRKVWREKCYTVYIAEWALDYLTCCEEVARSTPHWSTIAEVQPLESSHLAYGCPGCMRKAEDELSRIASWVVQRVRCTIEKVRA